MQFGVGIDPLEPYVRTIELAKLAEESEYDQIWIPDERFHREVFSTMALCAINTEKVKIGTAVTDPFIRHPALTALAIATVDEISTGRTVLGIGAGFSGFHELCIERRKPALAMREMVFIIRDLLSGKKVCYDGQIIKVNGAKLGFRARSDIPIYIAGRGPMVLKLAGELADGVIIGAFASQESLKYAFGQIEKGAKKAGRSIRGLDVVSWLYTAVSENGQLAKNTVRPYIMWMIYSSWPGSLKKAGVKEDVAKPIIEFLDRLREQEELPSSEESKEVSEAASKLVPDDYVDKFSLAGTPEECIEKVKELSRLGIKQVAILPFPHSGEGRRNTIKTFADRVMPQFRSS